MLTRSFGAWSQVTQVFYMVPYLWSVADSRPNNSPTNYRWGIAMLTPFLTHPEHRHSPMLQVAVQCCRTYGQLGDLLDESRQKKLVPGNAGVN